ncbi:MAG: hypothetical protein MK008_15140 [Bdellovibrionales bacterium]|nr:hypothetical protein [Bdellovibrionales bacterium]
MKKNIFLILFLILNIGCSTLKRSLLTGVAIGGSSGALLGNTKGVGNERRRNTNKGLIIGSLLGAGISYLAYKDKNKKKLIKIKESQGESKGPLLTKPKIKRIWVKDKVQGKRFIKGHWEYVIEEQSVWSSQ